MIAGFGAEVKPFRLEMQAPWYEQIVNGRAGLFVLEPLIQNEFAGQGLAPGEYANAFRGKDQLHSAKHDGEDDLFTVPAALRSGEPPRGRITVNVDIERIYVGLKVFESDAEIPPFVAILTESADELFHSSFTFGLVSRLSQRVRYSPNETPG